MTASCRRPWRAVRALALGALVLVLLALLPAPGWAATFAVTNTADSGAGSLRQAITSANGNGVTDTITFSIAGSGPHVISLASALPQITDTVTVNGWSEPDFAGSPVVRIDGASAGVGVNGFRVGSGAASSQIRGLMITGMSADGIRIDAGANSVSIRGNWIGTSGTGSTGVGNTDDGIDVAGATAVIGGTGVNDPNVITNNGDDGISIDGAGATGHLIRGNYIGIDPDGSSGGGNVDDGIVILSGTGNTIGGTSAATRNVISKNFSGIDIRSSDNLVQGNYIGTDSTGALDRGNRSNDGVNIAAGTGNTIGGTAVGAGNLIAFNKLHDGVGVSGSANGNPILGNRIHSNDERAIDLDPGGVTANDAGDVDAGPNNTQNFPVLTSASTTGTQIMLAGTLDTNASRYYRIEFYSNAVQDPSGNGEADSLLGSLNVMTNASGTASFSTVLNVAVPEGRFVTATATESDVLYTTFTDTSEMGPNVVATTVSGAPTAPTVSGGSLTWQNAASVTVSASGSTAFGGGPVAGYEYRTSTNGGSTWSTATAGSSRAVTAQGETLLQFRSIDGSGNTSAWSPSSPTSGSTVRLDRTNPTAPAVSGGSLSWQSVASITVTGSGSTDSGGSGLVGYEYRTSTDGGATWGSASLAASQTVTAEGETLVQVRSIDNAGNTSAWTPTSATAGSTARIDRTIPTAPTVSGGSLAWQSVASITITGSGASGGASGLAGYEYRTSTNGGSTWGTAVAGASVTITAEGETLVQYRSLDGAGNASAWTPSSATAGSTARIDRTIPTAPTVSGGSLAWQSVASITITGSGASGGASGLAGYEYRTSTNGGSTWGTAVAGASVTITAEGETLVQYRSLDGAGNASAWTPSSATAGSTARIDRTIPSAPTVSGGSLSWQSVPSITITGSGASGGASGLAGYEYRTSTNGGSTWGTATAGASVSVTAEGETLVQYRSIDGAGNVSAWTPSSATAGSTARIDRTIPTAPTVAGGSLAWQNTASITITGSGSTDAGGSSLTGYQYRTSVDGGSTWGTAAAGASVTITAEGETLVQYRSLDGAGNTSAWTPSAATAGSTARIDRTIPTAPTVSGGSLAWQSVASITITGSGASGGASGLAGYEYRTSTDGGSTWGTAAAGASVTVTAEGETLVQYRSLDGAGNASAWMPSSATAGSTARIDRTIPTAPTVAGGSLSWQNTASISITGSGSTDSGGSNLSGYEYRTSTNGGTTWGGATTGASVAITAEGETLVQYRSLDAAGNVSAWAPASATAGSTARIDRTNPTAPTVAGGSLAWQNIASITITGSASTDAGGSSLSGYEHRTSTNGGSTWGTAVAGASVTITAEGETLVQYRSLDGAGNSSAWTPSSATAGSTARIDRTNPTAHRRCPVARSPGRTWRASPSRAPDAAGGASGLAGYEYRTSTDGGTVWSSATAGASASVTAEGETLVQYRSLDGAGNASAWTPSSATAGSTARIDRTNPTAPTVSGGSLAWQNVASITITGSGSAGGASGLSGYEYRTSTDGGIDLVERHRGRLGQHHRRGRDAGAVPEHRRRREHVGLDPVLGHGRLHRPHRPHESDRSDGVSGGSLTWQNVASITITASGASGGDSGLAGYEYRTSTDGGSTWGTAVAGTSVSITAEGETLVQYRSIDGAGNTSAWTPSSATAGSTARIDRTEPDRSDGVGWLARLAERGERSRSRHRAPRAAPRLCRATSTAPPPTADRLGDGGRGRLGQRHGRGRDARAVPLASTGPGTRRPGPRPRPPPARPPASTAPTRPLRRCRGGSLAWQNVASITITGSGAAGGASGLVRLRVPHLDRRRHRLVERHRGRLGRASPPRARHWCSTGASTAPGTPSAWTPSSATAGSTARIDRTNPTAPTVSGGSLTWQSVASITITASGASGGASGLAGYEYRSSTDGGSTWGTAVAGDLGERHRRGRDPRAVPLARRGRQRLGLDALVGHRRLHRPHRPQQPHGARGVGRLPRLAERRLDHDHGLGLHRLGRLGSRGLPVPHLARRGRHLERGHPRGLGDDHRRGRDPRAGPQHRQCRQHLGLDAELGHGRINRAHRSHRPHGADRRRWLAGLAERRDHHHHRFGIDRR